MTESKLDSAVHWLWHYLKDGPKPCGHRRHHRPGTVYGDGVQAGHAGMTVRTASDELKVKRKKVGKLWYWSLPEGCEEPKPVAVPKVKPLERKRKRRPRKLVITISLE